MPIKGALLQSKDPENPALGLLGVSSSMLVMDEEIRPMQVVDPSFEEFRRLPGGLDLHWQMRDGILYRVDADVERLVPPESL